VWRGRINKIRPWGGQFPSGHEKKVKNHGLVHRVMHDFYMKINLKGKNWAMQSHVLVLPPCDCIAQFDTRE
jgi:predicted SprT family Zn-dependent metalloprotease